EYYFSARGQEAHGRCFVNKFQLFANNVEGLLDEERAACQHFGGNPLLRGGYLASGQHSGPDEQTCIAGNSERNIWHSLMTRFLAWTSPQCANIWLHARLAPDSTPTSAGRCFSYGISRASM